MTDKNRKSSVLFLRIIRKVRGCAVFKKTAELVRRIKTAAASRKKRYFPLYFELILTTVIGIILSGGAYALIQTCATYYIDVNLTTEEKKNQREVSRIEELQEYVFEKGISSDSADSLLSWDTGSRYVHILVYNDLFAPNQTGKMNGEMTREDLESYAALNGLYLIDLSDGTLAVAINDFSEFYYYNVSATVNLIFAMCLLSFIIIERFRRLIARINRLESDVAVVTYSDMNHAIDVDGKNDIAKLAANVETMRKSILDNLRKEQAARDANTELITSLSHDIRTPLTVMLGYLEMMKDRAEDAELCEYIETTERTALRLKQLSDDMFKYFLAFGNTGEEITLGEYDADTLLTQMLSEHLVLLGESGYEVKLYREGLKLAKGANIITDADNLMRIIDNIFSNLYKYADRKHPIKITLSTILDVVVLEFENRVLEDTSGAESNRIGLRTCSRLAEFIAESFEYRSEGGVFTTRMALKMTLSNPNTDMKPLDFSKTKARNGDKNDKL